MYWSKDTRVPDNMSRDRYFSVRNNLKQRDDVTITEEEKVKDKFWKVRLILQTVVTGYLSN